MGLRRRLLAGFGLILGLVALVDVWALLAADSATGPWMLGALGIALGIGAGVAYLTTRAIASRAEAVQGALASLADREVRTLERGLTVMAAGDLTVEVRPETPTLERPGPDEIGKLAGVTNVMVGRVQATVASYQEARARLIAIVTVVTNVATAVRQMTRTASGVVDTVTSLNAYVEGGCEPTTPAGPAAARRAQCDDCVGRTRSSDGMGAASAEEMSARAGDVQAQADALTKTTQELRVLLGHFRVECPPPDEVVPRRRAADWRARIDRKRGRRAR